MIAQSSAAKVVQWKPLYGDEVPGVPLKPQALEGDVVELEGVELQILHPGQGDGGSSTVVWIPVISTLVTGDLAYDGKHVWLAETNSMEHKRQPRARGHTRTRAGHRWPSRPRAG